MPSLFNDKTEAPTPRRREEARKKGQVARSPEVNSLAVLAIGLLSAPFLMPMILGHATKEFEYFLGPGLQAGREGFFNLIFYRVAGTLAIMTLPLMVLVGCASLISGSLQSGFLFTAQSLSPDFSRISPSTGIKRMFSWSSAVGGLKALLKVVLVAWVAYVVIRGAWDLLLSSPGMELKASANLALEVMRTMTMRLLIVLGLVAAADYAYQRYQFEMNLRMTRQELKEEQKHTEGDPLIRSILRRRYRQIAFQRMMQEVPRADVIVTNPTHLAVAVRYDQEAMAAPRVLAKGQRTLAERIVQVAREHRVPVVQNPPLAQALHKVTDVGSLVPQRLYQAVAEVLAYVYRVSGRAQEFVS